MNYEQIENYLHNGLTEAERTAFEAEMAADPALAETVTLYRDIEAKMQGSLAAQAGEPALRQQLETLSGQYFGKNAGASATAPMAPIVSIRRRRIPFYIAGAAAALLVLLLIRPFGGSEKFDALAVYEQFGKYEAPPSWGAVRGHKPANGTISESDSLLTLLKAEVTTLLEQKKYPEALPKLEKIIEKDSNDIMATLAKGACYIETNDSARANQVFLGVENAPSATQAHKKQATWYKALLYLKYKDIKGCRAALQSIQADKQAASLLKALPKP